MAIEDFRRLFSGQEVKKEMFEECQLVNSIYADIATPSFRLEGLSPCLYPKMHSYLDPEIGVNTE